MEKYIQFMENDYKSEKTIKIYIRYLNDYLKWYKESFNNTEFKTFKLQNIKKYIKYLESDKIINGKEVMGNKAKTVNVKLSALKKYEEFLVEEGLQKDVIITKKLFLQYQHVIASPTTITYKEVEGFRQTILNNSSIRNYTLVSLLQLTGARISEALDLKNNDIDIKHREVFIRHGKRGKQRTSICDKELGSILKEYFEYKKENNIVSDYLFPSKNGGRLDVTVINRVFNKYSDTITPHTLRHHYVSFSLNHGYSIQEMAYLVGHSNINTTAVYSNPNMEEMKNKADKNK